MKFIVGKSFITIFACSVVLLGLPSCESARFENAYRQDTVEEYKEFKREYPDGEYSSLVDERLRELEEENAYFEAKNTATTTSLSLFLQKYPESKYFTEIKNRLIETEIRLVAEYYELLLAGSGNKTANIVVENKTGTHIKLFGTGQTLFEFDMQPEEIKHIESRGGTILVCKDFAGKIHPDSIFVSPEDGKVNVEIWVTDSISNGKIIAFFKQE